ncbi:MAG: patatin-like phospholipase family protein, partial [Cyanobacteriota bacterium]
MLVSNNLIKLDNYRIGKLAFKGTDNQVNEPATDPLNKDKVKINNVDSIGWVLSGGGAKGVFEIGVACALAKAGMLPDVIVGTSVGALNAAALAEGDVDNAVRLWKEISKDKVYKSKVGSIVIKGLGQILNWLGIKNPAKIKSILDNTPLRKLVREEANPDELFKKGKKLPVELMFGVTALNNGKEGLYATAGLYDKLKEEYDENEIHELFKLDAKNFEDALIASTSIPLAFPAVQIKDELFVDGGTGNNTPAKNGVDALFAINQDLKEGLLFVVMLSPQEKDTEERLTEKNADLGKVGIKTLNIVLDNTAKMDVKMTQKITREIERWDVINIQVQETLDKIGKAA